METIFTPLRAHAPVQRLASSLNRKGVEQSQLEALRKLNEVSPSLINQIQYSGCSFDFGI